MNHTCHERTKQVLVLSSMWLLEYEDMNIDDIPTYRMMDTTEIYLYAMQPEFKIINAESIYAHCLLIPYQEASCVMMHIKHPSEWADEFFALS